MLEEIKSCYFINNNLNQKLYYYIGSVENGAIETGYYENYCTDSIMGSIERTITDRFPIYFLSKREAMYYMLKLEDSNIYPYEKLEIRITNTIQNGKIMRIVFYDETLD